MASAEERIEVPTPSASAPDGGEHVIPAIIGEFQRSKSKATQRFDDMMDALDASMYRRGNSEFRECEDARTDVLQCYKECTSSSAVSSANAPTSFLRCIPKMERYKKCVDGIVVPAYYSQATKVRVIAEAQLEDRRSGKSS